MTPLRYVAKGMRVYDRKNHVVVEDHTKVVLVEAAKRHAQARAIFLNALKGWDHE